MDRREFIGRSIAAAVIGAPVGAEAQPAGRLPKVGVILPRSAVAAAEIAAALSDGLRQLGYIEGETIFIHWHFADGKYERLPAVTEELLKAGVTLLVVGGTTPAMVVNKATTVIPIVFIGVSDAISAGLVSSLARPGGNASGLVTAHEDAYAGKSLELLKEAFPMASRVAVLHNSANPFNVRFLRAVERAAAKLDIQLDAIEARTPQELEGVMASLEKTRPKALLVATDPFLAARARDVVKVTTQLALPAMFGFSEYAKAGGLMSYGANLADMYRRAAYFIDRILKGAKPAELPVEQPTKFEFVINLKTAKALGLTMPPSLLLRADQVIE